MSPESLRFPIATERLHLRPYAAGDVDWMHRVFSRPDVTRYLLDPPWSREVAARKLDERMRRTGLETESGSLSLVAEFDGAPMGAFTLWRTDVMNHGAEIGWTLDPTHGGRGFAAEAARALVGIAFDHYGLQRIAAQMDGRNAGSAKVAEAIGMRREALLRRSFHCKGEWTDNLVYGILRDDR
ncbi:GNAT family N-acetyltransferase [Tsukamurella sp. 1534]|uniref:GNAT family N-acetyltransferase n=1 Tax=Tsukamurella sp. 1534 TaxID=1151061 RepID=UPI0002D83CE9|nr:GNAT family protein [Tsukamurella sp. 1534]